MTSASTPPAALTEALARLLDGVGRKELRQRAQRISQEFRARAGTSVAIRDEADALAYALTRFPATYAATASTLRRLKEEIGDFTPQSVLDAGCGLGGAAAAALETWPEIERVSLVDRSPHFLQLAQRLAGAGAQEDLRSAAIVSADLTRLPESLDPADLVIASYSLTEISNDALPSVLDALWRRSSMALAIVEPGTPRDHARLLGLRARLIAQGATIASPCPHDAPCPLAEPDWCHFATRLPRSRDHRTLKDAEAPFEDEKFSYLVAVRRPAVKRRARVIAPPRRFKWGVSLRLCGPAGVGETKLLKRDKAKHAALRSLWGDAVEMDQT